MPDFFPETVEMGNTPYSKILITIQFYSIFALDEVLELEGARGERIGMCPKLYLHDWIQPQRGTMDCDLRGASYSTQSLSLLIAL